MEVELFLLDYSILSAVIKNE